MYVSTSFMKFGYTRETITDMYYFLERIEYNKPNSHVVFYMKKHAWEVRNDAGEKIQPTDELLKLILEQTKEFNW